MLIEGRVVLQMMSTGITPYKQAFKKNRQKDVSEILDFQSRLLPRDILVECPIWAEAAVAVEKHKATAGA